MSGHLERLFPRPDPAPVPGCVECGEWARLRAELREAGNLSGATDANVLFRDHLARAHG